MARFRHWQLGQRSGLLEGLVIERLAPASGWRNEKQSMAQMAALTRRHAA
jgi:hypothetical protein